MGLKSSKELIYSVPLPGTETPDSTCTRRAHSHPDELVDNFAEDKIENTWDLFKKGVAKAGNSNCLGTRVKNENGKLGEYRWKTYKEVEEIALSVGISLIEMDTSPVVFFDENENEKDEENKQQQNDGEKKNTELQIFGFIFKKQGRMDYLRTSLQCMRDSNSPFVRHFGP